MKLSLLFATGAIALSLAGTAAAQTKIYITGSSAFRTATVDAVTGVLQGTVTVSRDTGSNAFTWTGGSIGTDAVTIKASFSGSAGGIATVASSQTVRFLPDGATGTANTDPRNSANPAETAIPDITMADNYQSSTIFTGNVQGRTYQTLTDQIVGVVTFRWIASNGFPAGQTMTTQIAQALFGNGSIPVALFTSSPTDQTRIAYATGRDPDSGTRITAFAESGVGVFSVVKQWRPVLSGNDVTDQALYPIQTINGISTQFIGNSGESSGSTLRGFTNRTLLPAAYQKASATATAGFYVTYMGTSDAAFVLASATLPAVSLKWNGVEFSTTAVQEGQYTFWGYQHLMYRPSTAGVAKTFADSLANQIKNTAAGTLAPNVKLSDMKVSRVTDGGIISANYF